MVCSYLCEVIKGEKLPLEIKRAVQTEITKQVPDNEKINMHSEMVHVLSRLTQSMMKQAPEEDVDISEMICYVKSGRKAMLGQIWKIK